MKRLEKDICDRLIGRVSNGFKKQVFCMTVSKCTKEVFVKYFNIYGEYCKINDRSIIGYNRIGDYTRGNSIYVFEFPYLPTFGHWTLNQYSILNDNDTISICSSSSTISIDSCSSSSISSVGSDFGFPTIVGDDLLSEELKEYA